MGSEVIAPVVIAWEGPDSVDTAIISIVVVTPALIIYFVLKKKFILFAPRFKE